MADGQALDLELSDGLVAEVTVRPDGFVMTIVKDGEFELDCGDRYDLRRAAAPAELAVPPHDMIGERVVQGGVNEDGVLMISFASGLELTALPKDDVEAWHWFAPNGLYLFALPGGGWDGSDPHGPRFSVEGTRLPPPADAH